MVEVAIRSISQSSFIFRRIRISPKNNENTSSLFSQGIPYWHSDVIECDVSSTSCRRITGLDLLGLDTRATLDENNCEAILSLAANSKVVGKAKIVQIMDSYLTKERYSRSVGDPFLTACIRSVSIREGRDYKRITNR